MAEPKVVTPVTKTVAVRQDKADKALASGLFPKIGKLVKDGETARVFLKVDGVLGEPMTAVAVPATGKNVYAEVRLRMVQSELDDAFVAEMKVHEAEIAKEL